MKNNEHIIDVLIVIAAINLAATISFSILASGREKPNFDDSTEKIHSGEAASALGDTAMLYIRLSNGSILTTPIAIPNDTTIESVEVVDERRPEKDGDFF